MGLCAGAQECQFSRRMFLMGSRLEADLMEQFTILGLRGRFDKKSNLVEIDRPQYILSSKLNLIERLEWQTIFYKIFSGSCYFLGGALTLDSMRRIYQNRHSTDKK